MVDKKNNERSLFFLLTPMPDWVNNRVDPVMVLLKGDAQSALLNLYYFCNHFRKQAEVAAKGRIL
jgi:hypothetical protein